MKSKNTSKGQGSGRRTGSSSGPNMALSCFWLRCCRVTWQTGRTTSQAALTQRFWQWLKWWSNFCGQLPAREFPLETLSYQLLPHTTSKQGKIWIIHQCQVSSLWHQGSITLLTLHRPEGRRNSHAYICHRQRRWNYSWLGSQSCSCLLLVPRLAHPRADAVILYVPWTKRRQ